MNVVRTPSLNVVRTPMRNVVPTIKLNKIKENKIKEVYTDVVTVQYHVLQWAEHFSTFDVENSLTR